MSRIIIISLLLCCMSCTNAKYGSSGIDDAKQISNIIESDNHSLVLLIHSGCIRMYIQDSDTTAVSETQIIWCSSSSLKYGFGSVFSEPDTLKNDIIWFSEYPKIEDYSILERNLDKEERAFITNSIKDLSGVHYVSPEIVKDDWEFILYVDNIKVASGYVSAIETFPQNIYDVIRGMVSMVTQLYPIPGFA